MIYSEKQEGLLRRTDESLNPSQSVAFIEQTYLVTEMENNNYV